ncbi:5-formyltetrahydrofolate cyclo-ligase [Algoriphagus sp.]|uniref:5-formyltetrahydrofolate cyclo-ligase n=1 Tax=Algoriphagus sp. TaxID=1872435 RepID=UPI0025CC2CEC|nr:5-formyltetrahydrofolate cyclo-ligase [Algoriphagus sp.]
MSSGKEFIRKKYKQKRKALSEEEVFNLSEAILHQFKNWLKLKSEINHFHIFLPIVRQNEVNTFLIRDFLFEQKKSVYTSLLKPGQFSMDTVKIYPKTKYQIDSLGIPTPLESEVISPNDLQLVLVPLLAFDLKGNRIGFGKGYYDKFLAELNPEVLKMGLSFFPAVPSISSELHDIPLDYCITGENVFSF